jgi:hypothetical protein
MRNIGILVALSVTLCGCGIAAKVQARQAYQLATANYDNCLEANQHDISACDADKQIMLSNQQEYNSFSAGIENGGVRTLNVNSQ